MIAIQIWNGLIGCNWVLDVLSVNIDRATGGATPNTLFHHVDMRTKEMCNHKIQVARWQDNMIRSRLLALSVLFTCMRASCFFKTNLLRFRCFPSISWTLKIIYLNVPSRCINKNAYKIFYSNWHGAHRDSLENKGILTGRIGKLIECTEANYKNNFCTPTV